MNTCVNPKDFVTLHGDKILIKEDEFDKTTDSGLSHLKRDDKKTIGTIVMGSNVNHKIFKRGDRVAYPTFAGVNVTIEGEAFKVLERREVFFTYNDLFIRGVNGFIVVKPSKIEESGLKIARKEEDSSTDGIVVSENANGTEVNEFINLYKGSNVVYSKFAGFPMSINGEKYIVLATEEIYFVKHPKK